MSPTSQDGEASLVSLVEAYCRRVCAVVLDQHDTTSVAAPLGIWLLLAACATAADSDDRFEMEDALGCSATDAAAHLSHFLDNPPPALHGALALWVASAEVTAALSE